MWWWWWWGEDTWLHGHVRCAQVCVMMFEGEGVMGTYISMYLCGGGEEGVIPVNVKCEFVIVLLGGGMDGYIWGVYGSMYISCKCEEAENVKVKGMLQSLTKTDLSVKVRGRML